MATDFTPGIGTEMGQPASAEDVAWARDIADRCTLGLDASKRLQRLADAAEAGLWRPIESAPIGPIDPILAGYRTQFGEWYWQRFESSNQPIALGYTHYLIPKVPHAD